MLVNPKSVRTFASEAAFEAWLSKRHDQQKEVWIKIFKKTAHQPSVTSAQAIDVALCWGWIDGIRKGFDEEAFVQRFTPRGPKSRWSQINRNNVERLVKTGRMKPAGQRHVDAAKADGRWDAAYASSSNMQVPPEVLAAIQANPKALATFRSLNRVNVYAIAYRLHHIKTPARRAEKLEEIIAMLARGESFHPRVGAGS
ncbi:MAG TPA: YdeI/OmpD-associated family protein [Polyangiaceae bacterium]